MAANSDVILFALSVYYGIVLKSTGIWLCPHSIEKYSKILLIPFLSDDKIISKSHTLGELLNSLHDNYPIPQYVDIFFKDIREISTEFRYGSGPGYYFPTDFFYKYWVVTRFLRIIANDIAAIPGDLITGIGIANSSRVLRSERHEDLLRFIRDIEKNVQSGNDFDFFGGWHPISEETKGCFIYPTIPSPPGDEIGK